MIRRNLHATGSLYHYVVLFLTINKPIQNVLLISLLSHHCLSNNNVLVINPCCNNHCTIYEELIRYEKTFTCNQAKHHQNISNVTLKMLLIISTNSIYYTWL